MVSQEDIIRMAREAGFLSSRDDSLFEESIERFAALVAAAENEACAKVIEDYDDHDWGMLMQDECAEGIRARGQA